MTVTCGSGTGLHGRQWLTGGITPPALSQKSPDYRRGRGPSGCRRCRSPARWPDAAWGGAGCDNAGEIKVSGTVKPDAGWTPTGSGFILVWPTGGGSTKNAGINVDPKTGNWHFVNNNWVDAIAGGLTSGKEYWCVVICNVQMGGNQASLATDAAKVTAKYKAGQHVPPVRS